MAKGAGVETLPTATCGAVQQGTSSNIMDLSLLFAVSAVFATLSRIAGRWRRRRAGARSRPGRGLS